MGTTFAVIYVAAGHVTRAAPAGEWRRAIADLLRQR
jgi:hypothetical protein